MRLEIGAGAAAGRAGGVLWSSAILAAISPLRAAFTSPLPAPRPLRCARPARHHSRLDAFFSLAFSAAFWSVVCALCPWVSVSPSLWSISASLPLWGLLRCLCTPLPFGLADSRGRLSVCLSLPGRLTLSRCLSLAPAICRLLLLLLLFLPLTLTFSPGRCCPASLWIIISSQLRPFIARRSFQPQTFPLKEASPHYLAPAPSLPSPTAPSPTAQCPASLPALVEAGRLGASRKGRGRTGGLHRLKRGLG